MRLTLTSPGDRGTGLATYVRGLMEGFRELGQPFEPIHDPGFGYLGRLLWCWYGSVDGFVHALDPSVFHREADVLTVHDLHAVDGTGEFGIGAPILRCLVRRIREKPVVVVTNSESTREEVVRWMGDDTERVVAVPLAPSPDVVVPEEVPVLGGGGASVLMVGDVKPSKRNVAMARALSSLDRDVVLHRAGPPIEGAYGDRFRREVERAANLSLVDHGFVDGERLGELLMGVDVLGFASEAEGFGLPVLEAAKMGTPSVVSDLPVFWETVGDLGVRDTFLPDAFRAAFDDPPSSEALRERSSNFSWEETARETLRAYRMVESWRV